MNPQSICQIASVPCALAFRIPYSKAKLENAVAQHGHGEWVRGAAVAQLRKSKHGFVGRNPRG